MSCLRKELLPFFYCLILSYDQNGFVAGLEDFNAVDFVKDIQRLHGFQNMLLMQNRNATITRTFVCVECTNDNDVNATTEEDWTEKFVERLMMQIHVPMLQMNELATYYLRRHFSDEILSIVYIDGSLSDHTVLLRNLVLNLRHMTLSKVLFLLNFDREESAMLQQLFHFCWINKLINVAVLLKDFWDTATFYSYTNFPVYSLEIKEISVDAISRQEIYPYRLADLKGFKLPYIIGGSDPRIIVYLDHKGKMVVAGFVGHFLRAFAQKFNCQLTEPLPATVNAFAPAQELIAAVRNGTVDISAGLTFPSIPMSGYSYPYEQMNWCVMMPVEPEVPGYEFYVIVFELSAFLMTLGTIILISMVLSRALYQHGYKADLFDIILHDDCLRGALGQPFSEVIKAPPIVRFIYLQICVLGILLTTSYNAYFATYVTSAPTEPALASFDDILNSRIKVYAWTPEFNELVGRVADFKHYVPMFYLENNYQQYLIMRDSFNTKYGYMMPTTKWNIISEQQKIFTSAIFKRDENLCFFNNIPMCFPVHENSIYMQTLYQLILETAQSGLTNYWRTSGFLEMIIARKLSFADLSTKRGFEPMEVGDLFYIWMGFAFMTVAVTLVFILEVCIYHRRRVCEAVRRIVCCRCGRTKEVLE